ncbi:uncharacterized protein LOC115631939 [Scaptodrosophila lebanonensis]|uniref:Uncharacterized protein LOC115631939 n=1 Tax=Drosophila lebanonensis TaxID=7225 RepID=A0A6J2U819_DROLE|nr:uncharacterized protein LOC115631939 [Scaptodrosophila lebanonensis]
MCEPASGVNACECCSCCPQIPTPAPPTGGCTSQPPCDDFKWMQANAPYPPCKQPCPCWATKLRRWYRRNSSVIRQIAKILEKEPDDVAAFLYGLTMRDFSKMINPMGSGWNWCRVPYCTVDTCDRYWEIFDDNGNLRYPHDPRRLFALLDFIQNSMCPPVGSGTDTLLKGAQSYATLDGSLAEMMNSIVPGFGTVPTIGSAMGTSLGSTPFGGGLNKAALEPAESTVQILRAIDNAYPIAEPQTYHESSEDLNEARPAPHVAYKSLQQPVRSSTDITAYNRRRGAKVSSHNQLRTLHSPRAEEMRRLLKRLKTKRGLIENDEAVVESFKEVDLANAYLKVRKRKTKATYDDISTLYSAVVGKEPAKRHHNLGLLNKGVSRVNLGRTFPTKPVVRGKLSLYNFGDSWQKKATAEKPKSSKGRKYLGDPMPVLLHEPYDQDKPWTWIRRHPNQVRVQADGQLGHGNIHRYRRYSVARELERARRRWSVHTTYSTHSEMDGENPERLSTAMFGTADTKDSKKRKR